MRHSALPRALPLAVAALLTLAGCGRDDVKVYKVDSTDTVATPPPPAPAASPSGMPATMPNGLPAPDNSGLPKLKYTLPDGWKEKPPTQLRVASFDIAEGGKTADVSVIPLGPMSGGDAANVNRWRGQVGQSPLDDAGLKLAAEPVQIAGQMADLYDIAGTAPGSGDEERVIAVILHTDDATWYFKLMGNGPLAEKNKASFIAFLKSVQFEPANGRSGGNGYEPVARFASGPAGRDCRRTRGGGRQTGVDGAGGMEGRRTHAIPGGTLCDPRRRRRVGGGECERAWTARRRPAA